MNNGGGRLFFRCMRGNLTIEVWWSSHVVSVREVYVEWVLCVGLVSVFSGINFVGLYVSLACSFTQHVVVSPGTGVSMTVCNVWCRQSGRESISSYFVEPCVCCSLVNILPHFSAICHCA